MATRDEPEQSYYVSCRARFIVRLEDFGSRNTPAAPAKPVTARSGKNDKKGESLQVVEKDGAFLLLAKGDDPNAVGSPHDQQSSSDGLTHTLDGIVPVTAQFVRNGIRTADTATVEVAFADFPFDPRTVRACGVQLFMGTISPEDYAKGGELRESGATRSGVRVPYNVLPDSYVDPYGRTRSNLRFEGWVDEWSSEFPENDAPTVTLQCTDNTRLLIDQEVAPRLTVGVDKPLDEAFAHYLANYPQFRGISVEYRPAVPRGQVPVLKAALSNTKYQPKLGPPPAGGGAGAKLAVWDYLTDVAGSVGHTLRFEGTVVIIQRARSLYDSRLGSRPDDPFTGRILPSGLELPRRLYAFGKNIRELKIGRKFSKTVNLNVEVRAFDTARKKTLVQRYPLKGDRVKSLNPGNAAEEKWLVKVVYGIKDEKVLRAIAQNIYEQVGRNELVTRLTTNNLGSYGGGNSDPDALDCLAGDAVDVRVLRQDDAGNTTVESYAELSSRGAEFLQKLGYSEGFAQAYQRALAHIGFQSMFKVKTMGARFDGQQEGIALDFELINYIEMRADKLLPSGEDIAPSDAQSEAVRVRVEDSP